MIILRLLLLLTNLHLKLLSTQGTGADKLLSTQRVKEHLCSVRLVTLVRIGVATHTQVQATKYRFELLVVIWSIDVVPLYDGPWLLCTKECL